MTVYTDVDRIDGSYIIVSVEFDDSEANSGQVYLQLPVDDAEALARNMLAATDTCEKDSAAEGCRGP